MPTYTFTRRSIVEEWFTVKAKNEQEALDMVTDGHPEVSIESGEWQDWYDNGYELYGKEDDLVTWVKEGVKNGK